MQLGAGLFFYVLEADWARLPPGFRFGDVAGVAVDHDDNVFVFNRSEHPLIVFDSGGEFVRSWGEGVFTRPHGIHIGHDGFVYCTDDGDHTVRKFTATGKLVMQIGIPGRPATRMSGRPFNRCTHTALSPSGDLYVSDGYGNAHVHHYNGKGEYLRSWGGSGSAPGEFNLPHNICCDAEGWVYVADRENDRVQIFEPEGRFETQWTGIQRPCAMCLPAAGLGHLYIGQLAPFRPAEQLGPHQGPAISVMTRSGEAAARLGGGPPGLAANQFVAPHGIAVDSAGNIFVGEVTRAAWDYYFPGTECPGDARTFRKLSKSAH